MRHLASRRPHEAQKLLLGHLSAFCRLRNGEELVAGKLKKCLKFTLNYALGPAFNYALGYALSPAFNYALMENLLCGMRRYPACHALLLLP